MARGYRRLSPADVDEIWVRMRAGYAAKPTARQLGLSTGTVRAYLVRCGGIRPDPRRRSPDRLSFVEREEISRGLAAGASLRAIAAGLGRSASTVSREVAAHGGRDQYRAAIADQQAWSRATRPKACKLAMSPAPGRCRGREAGPPVVTATDRRLAEGHLPRQSTDAGLAREHLSHPVRAVTWCPA
jgi:DNA-binding CsgD family transcriptional regulator